MKKIPTSVGVDIVDVSRFAPCTKKTHPFLKKVFTVREVEYCFSYSHPAPHLAGHFALKEAVSKSLGVRKYPFAEVEIRHTKDGAPCAYHKGKKLPVSISVSHTEDVAIGIAVA